MSDLANTELEVILENVQVNVGGSGPVLWGGITGQLSDQSDLQQAFDEKYNTPADGIPKTDLALDVQESLNKADTALQTHQSLVGYATENWVENKGYLTEHQSLEGYATETFVTTAIQTAIGGALNGSY